MGRPRKDLHLISKESLSKHRSRYAGRGPAVRPKGALGSASSWLNARQKRCWEQLVATAPQVLGESDRTLLECAAVLRAKLAKGTIRNCEMTTLLSVLQKLGMIAADRTPKEETVIKEKEFDEFV